MFEEGRTNDVEMHWERPLTEKSIRVEVTEKMNINMVSSRSKIRFVLFIRTLFYLSYIINALTLKNDPRLASLPKNG